MKYFEVIFAISGPQELLADAADVVAAAAAEVGFDTFEETAGGLRGWVQQQLFSREALDQALSALPFSGVSVTFEVGQAEDQDWNAAWEAEGFSPITVGPRLTITDGRHLPEDGHGGQLLTIDAHLAFGTGNHATTRLMAQALLRQPLEGATVLDCGTGTGVLALVALMAGAQRATGYDIDEWSVDNARHNARLNQLDNRFEAHLGDASVIGTLSGPFDVVTANINRNILLADMPQMAAALSPKGTLLLSGFYEADVPILAQRAQELGLQLKRQDTEDGWACMVLRI